MPDTAGKGRGIRAISAAKNSLLNQILIFFLVKAKASLRASFGAYFPMRALLAV